MHEKLKEQFTTLPKVDPKTVYSYVMIVLRDHSIIRVSANERQYSATPEKLRGVGQGSLFVMLLCYSRQ